jgi:predicted site-specific integrase-resolvase
MKLEYTIREVAQLRGVHPDTVRRQIRAGEIYARIELDDHLRSAIYRIPHEELLKIKAKLGGRPKKLA